MVFSRARGPAFTITTNGESGILQAAGEILFLGILSSGHGFREFVGRQVFSISKEKMLWISRGFVTRVVTKMRASLEIPVENKRVGERGRNRTFNLLTCCQ